MQPTDRHEYKQQMVKKIDMLEEKIEALSDKEYKDTEIHDLQDELASLRETLAALETHGEVDEYNTAAVDVDKRYDRLDDRIQRLKMRSHKS